MSVPSAFNENSALEWTYADAQGKHAVYVSSLGADGWIISAQAPTLETAIADGSTVFNSMTRN